MREERRVEVFKEGEWIHTDFDKIKRGDTFRLFELTGEPVVDDKGKTEWEAASEPDINEDGIYYIGIK